MRMSSQRRSAGMTSRNRFNVMSFSSEISIGNILTVIVIVGGLIANWVSRARADAEREAAVAAVAQKLKDFNDDSQTRYTENKLRVEGLASEVHLINESGGTSVRREITAINQTLSDHAVRLHSLSDIKAKLATLEERSSNGQSMMNDIKGKLEKLLDK